MEKRSKKGKIFFFIGLLTALSGVVLYYLLKKKHYVDPFADEDDAFFEDYEDEDLEKEFESGSSSGCCARQKMGL